MGKKLMTVTVRGQNKVWSFLFYGNPKYLKEWREDGLEIDEVVNTIPALVVACRMTRVWCFFQDMFNFKNPFKG